MMEQGEILCNAVLPDPPRYSGSAYIKFGVRKSLEISIVSAAAFFVMHGPEGVIQEARVVLGAVAPIPVRSAAAENILRGQRPEEAISVKAGEAASDDARPIDDFRASAEYRREMVKVFTRRALTQAYEELKLRERRRWK